MWNGGLFCRCQANEVGWCVGVNSGEKVPCFIPQKSPQKRSLGMCKMSEKMRLDGQMGGQMGGQNSDTANGSRGG